MKTFQSTEISLARRARAFAVVAAIALTAACSHLMMHGSKVDRPGATEFGLGPRTSAAGRYVATLTPDGPLRPRQMQTVRITVLDTAGRAIDDARLSVDGGMPQHGHGLPTRPRVMGTRGDGVYEIQGVRFNMGGWWELRVSIAAEAGDDVVTFNLDL